ncbi:hypothetical protein J7I80_16415 [Bacillus sp. ISL-41]|uniref:hypothetical protein n=1 Tax=Bacillus sp. ISL-41 TaxID=2819127 RepID=UPI001BECACE3|nr:hypothetical protein [Bacillus sp. ISL-41]MBT2643827.1 hypothetical protein [Bacillus sp. ISL-41]
MKKEDGKNISILDCYCTYKYIWLRGEMGLLISVPVASLSAGLEVSLLVAVCACGVSPVQLIRQDIDYASSILPTQDENALAFSEESTQLPLQSTGLQNLIHFI